MALFPRPILTNGATHSAQQFRMLVRDLANGAEGITQGDDLKVTERGTPGGGVVVGDGSAVVRGRANTFQGSYAACNIGAVDVPIAATGGSARSDMVILRIEDPEYEGTLDPETDEIAYFDVISNVSSSATTIPDSRTAIPLARIDIPSSTSTITNAMITDLRQVANPRRRRSVFTQSPSSISTGIGSSTSYSYFSTAAGVNVAVPDWATKVIVKIDVSPIRYDLGNFWGRIGATYGSSLATQDITLDDNQGSGARRIPAIIADTLTVPSAYRGTTQLLRVRASGLDAGQAGRIYVDSGTTFAYDVQFEEAPR
ncbi:hypothetical protein [Streptomyces chartreusis]|jgi:hypothetical protein|uniref:hypothetical protein n=1 Tax=Streptomyces chartreusis TaxID=1969 RepID=UPI0037DC77F7|nr:hypothetical protein OG938_48080 [Streptomyces chartreusis]WTA33854.1 hypothetical protein OIA45_48445 [Streptomyces chartreusis]